ncbi:hypothetical protein KY316_01475, partial [Candidatus Woesearchaeota archaeon]|nr:hypothetical protein [Candidatus Woesearchaeota archaeon]
TDTVVNVNALDVGEVKNIPDVFLEKVVSPCAHPATIAVPLLTIEAVKCKPQIKLSWDNDFCENIQGFVITRENDGYQWYLSKNTDTFTDDTGFIKWQTQYNYSIQAFYTDAIPRYSAKRIARIITGNPACENRCTNTEFCADSYKRAKCDANNRLVTATTSVFPTDCKDMQYTGTQWYCAGPNDVGITWCAQPGGCGSKRDVPFYGLFFTPSTCYEDQFDNPQACYFDRSYTSVDFCFDCLPKSNAEASCYLYRSQLACEDNNCGYEGCAWEDNVYSEVGGGLCYDDRVLSNIKHDIELNVTSRCELCSETADIFQNKFCDQTTCSRLGLCYSKEGSCAECSTQSSCYDFKTIDSCIDSTDNFQEFSLDTPFAPESAEYSDDACGLGRCVWNGTRCYKDGNDDGVDDCPLGRASCKQDNTPPESRPGFKVTESQLNAVGEDLVFNVSEAIYAFYFCISEAGAEKCTSFLAEFPDSPAQKFVEINPIARYPELLTKPGNYLMRYYAEDINRNKELIKEAQVYIDPVAPLVDVAYFVKCLNCETNVYPKSSNIEFTIFSNELVNCTDEFRGVQVESSKYSGSNTYKKIYPLTGGLDDGIYRYSIVCEDIAGNKIEIEKEIEVDSYFLIETASPVRATRQSDVVIYAETSDPATCGVRLDSAAEQLMSTADNFNHSYFKTLLPNTYHYYEIRCIDTDAGQTDVFRTEFSVDQLPPKTNVYLNNKLIWVTRNFWRHYEDSASVAKLVCEDALIQGKNVNFGCKEIKYCLTPGLGCEPNTLYTAPIQIANLSTLCYYSVDKGGNREAKKCGLISVDGTEPPNPLFNITLRNPRTGVSRAQTFDLVVETNKQGLCGYQKNFEPFMFNFTTPFDRSNFITHTVNGFTLDKKYPDTQPVYVWCVPIDKNLPDALYRFDLSYDTTAPNILTMAAQPSIVKEYPLETTLTVTTDDETTCRYGEVFNDFETAPFAFPVPETYSREHTVLIGGLVDQKSYTYKAVCRNLAGLDSAIKSTSFSVDLSLPAAITIVTPRDGGFYNETSLPLDVRTDKRAYCVYSNNQQFTADSVKQFTNVSADLKSFYAGPFNYSVGNYTLYVQCMFGTGAPVTVSTKFGIDTTAPVNLVVDDGQYQCSEDKLNITWSAQDPESGIAEYIYTIIPLSSVLVEDNATWYTTTDKFAAKSPSLSTNISYKAAVKAKNKAGMQTAVVESNGFSVEPNRPECQITNVTRDTTMPTVTLDVEASAAGALVTIVCFDNVGCAQIKRYGVSAIEADCYAVEMYTDPFEIMEDSFVCWDIDDVSGNKNRGSQFVQIPEEQVCPGDTDCDGMPDDWETQYGLNIDVDDSSVDFDNDGLTNLQEYRYGTDPTNPDTDGDGYSDYDEIFVYDTNPLDPDDRPRSYLLLWVLLIVVILLALAGGGYYFYSYYMAKKQGPTIMPGPAPAQGAAQAVPGQGVAPAGIPHAIRRAAEQRSMRDELVRKLREARRSKMESERQRIFAKFGKPGEAAPEKETLRKIELDKLSKTGDVFDRLMDLAKRESDFTKLEKITEAVQKKSAFDRLVDLHAEKRGGLSDLKQVSEAIETPKQAGKQKPAAKKTKAKPKAKAKPKKAVKKK